MKCKLSVDKVALTLAILFAAFIPQVCGHKGWSYGVIGMGAYGSFQYSSSRLAF